jgi:hypothetical protein
VDRPARPPGRTQARPPSAFTGPAGAPPRWRRRRASDAARGERPGGIDRAAAADRTCNQFARGGISGRIEPGHAGAAVGIDHGNAAGAANGAFAKQAHRKALANKSIPRRSNAATVSGWIWRRTAGSPAGAAERSASTGPCNIAAPSAW